jgi:hypothetical protein
MLLYPSLINTRQFTYVEGMLVIEHSDLNARGLDFGRVYDDACDLGITLVSQVTQKKIAYAITNTVRDAEGDLQYWDLTPAPYQHNVPDSMPRVRVYND